MQLFIQEMLLALAWESITGCVLGSHPAVLFHKIISLSVIPGEEHFLQWPNFYVWKLFPHFFCSDLLYVSAFHKHRYTNVDTEFVCNVKVHTSYGLDSYMWSIDALYSSGSIAKKWPACSIRVAKGNSCSPGFETNASQIHSPSNGFSSLLFYMARNTQSWHSFIRDLILFNSLVILFV